MLMPLFFVLMSSSSFCLFLQSPCPQHGSPFHWLLCLCYISCRLPSVTEWCESVTLLFSDNLSLRLALLCEPLTYTIMLQINNKHVSLNSTTSVSSFWSNFPNLLPYFYNFYLSDINGGYMNEFTKLDHDRMKKKKILPVTSQISMFYLLHS